MEKYSRIQQPMKPEETAFWATLIRYIVGFEEAVARVLLDITGRVQLDSVLITDQALLSAGTTLVQHKLGRKVRGFRVTDLRASAIIWRDATSTADLTKFLPLACSADVTISLEVF